MILKFLLVLAGLLTGNMASLARDERSKLPQRSDALGTVTFGPEPGGLQFPIYPDVWASSIAAKESREEVKQEHADVAALHPLPSLARIQKAIKKSKSKIILKPAFREELRTKPNGQAWIALIEKQLSQIKRLLPQTVHPELLIKILNDPTFSIELVPSNDRALAGAPALYLPITNKVLIGIDTDMDDNEMLRTLRNEMHHASLRYTNYRRQSNPNNNLPARDMMDVVRVVRPAIQEGWKTDPQLAQQHREALEAGFKRIEGFKALLKQSKHLKHASLMDAPAKEALMKALKVLANYQPMVHTDETPAGLYKELKKDFKKTRGGKTVIHFPGSRLPAYFMSERTSENNKVVLRYTFLRSEKIKDRANAFIRDLEFFHQDVYGKNSNYGRAYSDREDLDMELSSYMQELDPDILKHFFPEWCAYFSQYHQVEGYCHQTLAA